MVVAQQVPRPQSRPVGGSMLTVSKLKRWSINYYIDTAQAAERAAKPESVDGRSAMIGV